MGNAERGRGMSNYVENYMSFDRRTSPLARGGTRPRTDACGVRHEAGVNDDSGVRGRVGSLVDGCEECAVHDESAPGEKQRNAL